MKYSFGGNGSRLIAVSIGLFLASPAHAQSSVTLYGALDEDILYTNKTFNPETGTAGGHQLSLVDSGWQPSRFGITGKEDLGDGVQALFKLESGINATNGGFNDSNGYLFGRQAWVALNSRYGEVKAGLQFSPFLLSVDELDSRDFSFFGGNALIYVDNVAATGIFTPNAISYSSPEIAGWRAKAMLSLGNVAGSFAAGRAYSANVDYKRDGLLVTAAIYDSNPGGAETPIPSTVAFEGRLIGAAYDFGPVTAKAAFINYKVAGSFNNNVYSGGIEYRASSILSLNAGIDYSSDRDDTDNHSLMTAIGVQYNLSYRTMLYAQGVVVDNHGAMDTGISITGAMFGAPGTTVGTDLGIRHIF